MPGEDNLSSRFDYLFEPLDVEESVHDTETAGGRVSRAHDNDETSRSTAAPVGMAFAAFVLASLGAVAVVAVLLLRQPYRPQDPVNSPAEPSPAPTTVTEVPSQAATVAPPPPTQADSAPHGGDQSSPSTRAPISVAPESRPPFPNQGPRTGDNGGGGLLGGLL